LKSALPYTGLLIRRAQQAHVYLWQRLVSDEISSPQFGVISSLQGKPGMSQADLCAALDLDRSTIADIVQRLVDRGLVLRQDHEHDKRRYVLSLSEIGSREFFDLESKVSELDMALTKGLTEVEHRELMRLLTLMLENPSAY
jgi:DNA-binding MarR family transcriptional regulator